MNKREVIILVLAGLLCVFGLLNYFVLDKKTDGTDEEKIKAAVTAAENTEKTSQATIAMLKKGNGDKNLAYLKAKAEGIWSKDPFIYYSDDSQEMDDADAEKMPAMAYSGFIRLGENILGIINGMEYSMGDLLIDTGYKVIQITPQKVVLLTQNSKQVTLYLQQD